MLRAGPYFRNLRGSEGVRDRGMEQGGETQGEKETLMFAVDARPFKKEAHALVDRSPVASVPEADVLRDEIVLSAKKYKVPISAEEFAHHVSRMALQGNPRRAHKLIDAIDDQVFSGLATWLILLLTPALKLSLLALFIAFVVWVYQRLAA